LANLIELREEKKQRQIKYIVWA